jgi:hypothetical protein
VDFNVSTGFTPYFPTPMSKSKSLAVYVNPEVAALRVQRLHRQAMLHSYKSVAAAILAGNELNRVKASLKEKPNQLGFLEWFEKHRADLGFSKSTKDNYMNIAAKVRKDLPPDIAALLDIPSDELNPEQELRLLTSITKQIGGGGASLTQLYIDYGIIKPERVDPGSIVADKSNNGSNHRKPTPTNLLIQDELFGRLGQHGKVMEWWGKPVRIEGSKVKVPLWQTMTEAQKKAIEKQLVLSIKDSEHMLAQLREAKRK